MGGEQLDAVPVEVELCPAWCDGIAHGDRLHTSVGGRGGPVCVELTAPFGGGPTVALIPDEDRPDVVALDVEQAELLGRALLALAEAGREAAR